MYKYAIDLHSTNRCVNVCTADLAHQVAKADDFFLQVSDLSNQIVTDGLGFLLRVQGQNQLHGGKNTTS